MDFDCSGPSGAYPAGGVQLVDWLIRDLYLCDNVRTTSRDVLINAGPVRPFRAPGHPQGSWALEQMMDELADKIGMDPVEFRLRNIPQKSQAREGTPPYTTTGLRQCLEKGAEAFRWRDSLQQVRDYNQRNAYIKRGVHPSIIQIEHADTATTQFATPSGGSKTVPTEAPTVRNAAIALKQELKRMAAEDHGVEVERLRYIGEKSLGFCSGRGRSGAYRGWRTDIQGCRGALRCGTDTVAQQSGGGRA